MPPQNLRRTQYNMMKLINEIKQIHPASHEKAVKTKNTAENALTDVRLSAAFYLNLSQAAGTSDAGYCAFTHTGGQLVIYRNFHSVLLRDNKLTGASALKLTAIHNRLTAAHHSYIAELCIGLNLNRHSYTKS